MGAIAILGAIETAFLTVVKVTGSISAVCPTDGCDRVLTSDYASIFGIPLTVFGFLAYAFMAVLALGPLAVNPDTNKRRRNQLENQTWMLLFVGGTAMAVFSGLLMYILIFQLQEWCPYCIVSAVASLSLFVLAIVGRDWDDIGQLFFTGTIVALVTLVGAVGIYSATGASVSDTAETSIPGEAGPPVTTVSGPSEMALARHLAELDAKEYGAYWCPHCHEQKQLFGKEAFSLIEYVECDPKGQNPRPQLCREAGIKGFPTWEIDGKLYDGTKELEELADLSGYEGPREFQYTLETVPR